ncbi:hypothetical protein OSTOST_08836 [Ostertagia ostertagi]
MDGNPADARSWIAARDNVSLGGFSVLALAAPKPPAAESAIDMALTLQEARLFARDADGRAQLDASARTPNADITVVNPGGGVNAGEVTAGAKAPTELGIVTVNGGDVSAIVAQNFDVNQSRVFTIGQGNLLMWSSGGNIDAGRGAKTVTGAPAPVLRLDASGNLVFDTSGSFSGSGIAVLSAGNDLDLYAPTGEINAGEAGIRSKGNAFLGAERLVNANDIQRRPARARPGRVLRQGRQPARRGLPLADGLARLVARPDEHQHRPPAPDTARPPRSGRQAQRPGAGQRAPSHRQHGQQRHVHVADAGQRLQPLHARPGPRLHPLAAAVVHQRPVRGLRPHAQPLLQHRPGLARRPRLRRRGYQARARLHAAAQPVRDGRGLPARRAEPVHAGQMAAGRAGRRRDRPRTRRAVQAGPGRLRLPPHGRPARKHPATQRPAQRRDELLRVAVRRGPAPEGQHPHQPERPDQHRRAHLGPGRQVPRRQPDGQPATGRRAAGAGGPDAGLDQEHRLRPEGHRGPRRHAADGPEGQDDGAAGPRAGRRTEALAPRRLAGLHGLAPRAARRVDRRLHRHDLAPRRHQLQGLEPGRQRRPGQELLAQRPLDEHAQPRRRRALPRRAGRPVILERQPQQRAAAHRGLPARPEREVLKMKRIALALMLVASVAAQAQDAKPSKEREALRRAQAALRAAQEQQSTLQADKAKAEADVAAAQKDAASAKAQIAGSVARLKAREAELDTLRAQLQAAKDAQQLGEAKAIEREQGLQQQMLSARQESAARQQANQALTQLLERSTTALADAEAKNRQLYAIGQQLLTRWQGRAPLDTALLQDPVLGLTAVRFEDQAEKLRAELAAQRVPR